MDLTLQIRRQGTIEAQTQMIVVGTQNDDFIGLPGNEAQHISYGAAHLDHIQIDGTRVIQSKGLRSELAADQARDLIRIASTFTEQPLPPPSGEPDAMNPQGCHLGSLRRTGNNLRMVEVIGQ